MDPSYFMLQVLFEFQSKEGCSPRVANREADIELLKQLRADVAKKLELPEKNKLVNEDGDKLLELLFSELSPVAAKSWSYLKRTNWSMRMETNCLSFSSPS